MKTLNAIVKIVTALAAVAGAIYVAATYGDQIVAWCKKTLAAFPKCPCCQDADAVVDTEEEPIPDAPVAEEEEFETPAEEPAAEEAPAEEAEEEPVEEIPLTPVANEPVAEEHDFAE